MQRTVLNRTLILFCIFFYALSNLLCSSLFVESVTEELARFKGLINSFCFICLLIIIKTKNKDSVIELSVNFGIAIATSFFIDLFLKNNDCYKPNDYLIVIITILLYLLDKVIKYVI